MHFLFCAVFNDAQQWRKLHFDTLTQYSQNEISADIFRRSQFYFSETEKSYQKWMNFFFL